MHIYQCFLVLIVALMHLPNIHEHLRKTKTQAPWPPLLLHSFIYELICINSIWLNRVEGRSSVGWGGRVVGVTRSAMQWISLEKNTVSREVHRTMLGRVECSRAVKASGFSQS